MGYFHGQLGSERGESGLIGEVSVCGGYELISFGQDYACFLSILSWAILLWLCHCEQHVDRLKYAINLPSTKLNIHHIRGGHKWPARRWIISFQIVTWESSGLLYVRLNNQVWRDFYESRNPRWNRLIASFMIFYSADCRCGQMSFHLQNLADDCTPGGPIWSDKDQSCKD